MRTLAIRSVILAALGCAVLATKAHATPLLTPGYETQVETWLGMGPLDFTNIFTKSGPSDTTVMWHAAVDGQGPTVSLLEAVDSSGAMFVIGGYDPQSWSSSGVYHFTPADAARTAFIFNLTTSELRRQKLTTDPGCGPCGQYQTYNWSGYGPIFGGGSDLFGGDGYLSSGYEFPYSYGAGNAGLLPLDNFTMGALETYSFAPAQQVPVPEPASLILLGTGAVVAILRRRRALIA